MGYWQRLLLGIGLLGIVQTASAADADKLAHFERRVRPLLIERCQKCHGGEKAKGGLRLDSAAATRRGGETGPAVVPSNPEESLLIQAVRHQNGLEMPPDGKLSEAQIADLVKWIAAGAEWPDAEPTVAATGGAAIGVAPRGPRDGDLADALQLWLKADALTLADGEPVPVWPDQSGHGRDLTATKGVRSDGVGLPGKFVIASQILQRPAVRFETTTGLAASPDNPVDIQGNAALTMLLVMNLQPHEAQPPYDGVIGIGNPANPGGDPGRPLAALVQINRGENHALHFAGGWNQDASLGAGSFKPLYGRPLLLVVTKQPGPIRTTTRFFLNGQYVGLGGSPVAVDVTGAARLAAPTVVAPLEGRDTVPEIQHRSNIGAYMGKAVSWAGSIQGDVGEVIVYNKALTDTERQGIENHLADKYGLLLANQVVVTRAVFTPEEKAFWAFQPVRAVTPPASQPDTAAENPIDRFIRKKLDAAGLQPAPPASRPDIIRRLTLDLTGLPPTPDEIAAFIQDDSPRAHENIVERLLASPHYGERWGRHWLDVVRYAESTANDANAVMRFAWRYRNYVIDALNADMPYDQFLIEQLAGDLLTAADVPTRIRQTVATGFLMVGPKALAETDKEQSRLDIVDDQIDVTGRAILGLTLACARCHDHKFDAIRAVDCYSLAGIFRSTEPFQDEARNSSMWWEFPISDAPGPQPFLVMAPKEAGPRNLRVHLRGNRFTLGSLVPRGFPQILSPQPPDIHPAQSGRLELARWIASPQNPLTARVLVNRLWQHHFGRGLVATSDNFGNRGDRPSHPELLDWLAAEFIKNRWSLKAMHRLMVLSETYRQSTQQQSAAKTVDPDNRLLSYYPRRRLSAEELRDSVLAVSGQLDRGQGTTESSDILWKEAEVQDAKRGFAPNRLTADHPFYTDFRKRSIYLPVVRNMLPDVLALFDAADPNGVTAVRNETTVPSQALFLLNSRFIREQSKHFARRLLADTALTDEQRVNLAHELAFGRKPTSNEFNDAQSFLAAYLQAQSAQARPESERKLDAWQSYCQTLFCQNEFLYAE